MIKIRERRTVLLLPLALALACGGGSKTDSTTPGGGPGGGDQAGGGEGDGAQQAQALPAIPSSPAPMPDGLLAVVSIGDPKGQLDAIGAYADAVNPGFGAMIGSQFVAGLSSVVGAPGLDGYDLSRPMYIMVFDPQRGGADILLVLAVGDEAKMAASVGGGAMVQSHEGYAAIGRGAAVVAGSPYALSNLAKTTPPKYLQAIVHMNRVMDSYRGKLEEELKASFGASRSPAEMKAAEGMITALASIEQLEATLEADGTSATLSFVVHPVQGSGLAAWSSAQQPASYDVAARLPKGPWMMMAAGRIDWGPMKEFWSQMAAAQGNAALADWFTVFGQEIALGVSSKQNVVRMAGLVQVTDGAKLGTLMKDYVAKMAAAPKKMDSMEVTAKAGALKTGGATLHGITILPGADASPEMKKEFETQYGKGGMKSYFGLAGDWLVFALDKDKDSKALAGKLVTGAKTKKAPKSALGALFDRAIADSKARKESGVLVFDVAAVSPDPVAAKGAEVTAGLAFEGPLVRSRITVPPATGRFVVGKLMGGMGGP